MSGVSDSKVLRAVEQRMINYVRTKMPKGISGNERNAMNLKDYKKYEAQVEKLLKDTGWQKYIDDFFKFD